MAALAAFTPTNGIEPGEGSRWAGTDGGTGGGRAALDAITGVLARELGRKIRVNTINPGLVETEGSHTAGFSGSDFEQSMLPQVPLGRTGRVGDIAPIAVFLASDESGWLTGEQLVASGGMR